MVVPFVIYLLWPTGLHSSHKYSVLYNLHTAHVKGHTMTCIPRDSRDSKQNIFSSMAAPLQCVYCLQSLTNIRHIMVRVLYNLYPIELKQQSVQETISYLSLDCHVKCSFLEWQHVGFRLVRTSSLWIHPKFTLEKTTTTTTTTSLLDYSLKATNASLELHS